jgi:hypothetical protein
MAINLVLRRPVPAPAPQLRIVWQGFRNGDVAEARWVDASARPHRWSGSRGLAWLQRDALQANEEWKINLAGVPGDIQVISLSMSSAADRTVGVVVQQLAGDPNAAVLHPGAELAAGAVIDLVEFRRVGPAWQVTALNSPVGAPTAAVDAPPPPGPPPHTPPVAPAATPFPGWSGPVSDGPAPSDPTAGPPVSPPVPLDPTVTRPWADHIDDGPRVSIPDRLTPAVDAARSTGKVRRARVSAVVDLSASMYPWITSGAVADILTAVQAVAGAAQRPSVSARFFPDGADVDLQLDAEPAAALRSHLRAVGLRTGDRGHLVNALPGPGSTDTVTLMVTDDPSLANEPDAAGATTVVLGGDTRSGPGAAASSTSASAVFLPPGPVDVDRLARELADRCFTTARQ